MSKFLLILIVVLAAYWIIKSYKRKSTRAKDATAAPEDMVRCEQCGVHLPRSESVMTRELFFCSTEHRRLHQGAD